ncbi:UvrD-helicase domain-containing protein [Neobacillus muris]|uniref:UvrD-helicase domain-containing protein n=1 Tax=Neobacillus muris TaxID=2941334 RepID=UPI002407B54E|nr:UvrD-helicase domain-containing protein [Neobacillus muris]
MILSLGSPMFLMTGPGSGKTRVLLWRTVNAIVLQNVLPERIFLSIFTEKAEKPFVLEKERVLSTAVLFFCNLN